MSQGESSSTSAPAPERQWPLLIPVGSAGMLVALILVLVYVRAVTLRMDSTPMEREFHNAPFITTPYAVVDAMIEVAAVTKDDMVYDLGCGDGRILVEAAKKTGCHAVGFDIDPERVAEARANAKEAGVDHLVRIEEKDVFTLDLREASVVMIYLLPHMNVKLVPQLQKLRPGSRIVTHDFGIDGYKPDKIIVANDPAQNVEHKLHYWANPLPLERTAPLLNRQRIKDPN